MPSKTPSPLREDAFIAPRRYLHFFSWLNADIHDKIFGFLPPRSASFRDCLTYCPFVVNIQVGGDNEIVYSENDLNRYVSIIYFKFAVD